MKFLVAGAGGFIGHHLVNRLKAEGHWVRGADVKRPEFAPSACDEFQIADLRCFENCRQAADGMDGVCQLAADMGGIGYIASNYAHLSRNNTLINSHMLEAARTARAGSYLFTSSACVYPDRLQQSENVAPLREDQALPAAPEKGYGWEKLFAEQLVGYYREEFGLDARVVRLHNVYGPLGAYDGGREKAPAALCRKAALARDGGGMEIWGDGSQTRSFCYIDDCIEGLRRIMASDCTAPINLGSEELVSVDRLVEMVCAAAGKRLRLKHDLAKPQGVRGRNSDNARLREVTGWQPTTPLAEGIRRTYRWIAGEMARRAAGGRPAFAADDP